MNTDNEALEREFLELLVEQNPMLNKDSIIALLNDIIKDAQTKNASCSIKDIIINHNY